MALVKLTLSVPGAGEALAQEVRAAIDAALKRSPLSATALESATSHIEIRVESANQEAVIIVEHRGLEAALGVADLPAWFGAEVVTHLITRTTAQALGDWITDRHARRPWGTQARATYADPLYHYPNFRVMLSELSVQADDFLLEVGCGGGALLKEVLRSGCRAAGIDHSYEMAQLARHNNQAAVGTGRLQVLYGDAHQLPFADDSFSCAAMTGVLGFLSDPVYAFREVRRTLRPGGRFVSLGSDPNLRGTPAAPEPFASRLCFYEPDELAELARNAGFNTVQVVLHNLEEHARAVGVPDEHIPLFQGESSFLLARK